MNRIFQLSAGVVASAAVVLACVASAHPAGARPTPTPEVTNLSIGGDSTDAVAVGDLNGDHVADIVSSPTGLGMAVSLGEGDHQFAPARIYGPPKNLDVNPLVLSLVLADVTGDGRTDVVGTGANNNVVILWRGRGDGTFAPAHRIDLNSDPLCDRQSGDPCQASFPFQAVVADFNDDGIADIATVNTDTDNVAVLLGIGRGRFARPTLYPLGSGSGPQSIAVRDLDDDGSPDLVVADTAAGNLSVLYGKRQGGFEPPVTYATGLTTPSNLVLADLTGDGIIDAALSDDGYDGKVVVLTGHLGGRFVEGRVFSAGINPTGLAAADFNRDGRTDLAVAESGSDAVAVFRGGRHRLEGPPATFGLDGAHSPTALTAAQVDDNGYPDLVTGNSQSPSKDISLIWNPGS